MGGRAAAPLKRSQTVLAWLLLINTVGPGMSVPLYWFVSHGTVGVFGGDESSDSAAFWCQLVGAGDMMFAYICACALLTPSGVVRRLVVRAIGLYSIAHFGGFLRGSWQPGAFPEMPAAWISIVTPMLIGSQIMHVYYGTTPIPYSLLAPHRFRHTAVCVDLIEFFCLRHLVLLAGYLCSVNDLSFDARMALPCLRCNTSQ